MLSDYLMLGLFHLMSLSFEVRLETKGQAVLGNFRYEKFACSFALIRCVGLSFLIAV
jgi:hypothetical protein